MDTNKAFSSWEVNTALQPLDVEAIKAEVEAGNAGKKKKVKALWEAYVIASEEHDLQYFKDLLKGHEQAMQVDAEEKAAAEAKKLEAKEAKEKKKTTTKRKSTAAVADEDVTMEDAGVETPAAKPKGKKRKKEEDVDEEEKVRTPVSLQFPYG